MRTAEPFAYIANSGDNTVSVIDIATNQIVATVAVGSSPVAIAANPDGKSVYVANPLTNTVSVIDTATRTVVALVKWKRSRWALPSHRTANTRM